MASAKRPGLSLVAPVNAPALYPKSSDSRSVSGRAPQLTATNGPLRRGLKEWMVRATLSLPVPVSPRIKTVLGLAATAGKTSNTFCMTGLRLTRSPMRHRPSNSRRNASTSLKSRKVSAPPTTVPSPSRITAVEMLIGIRSPSASTMNPDLPITGFPVLNVRLRAQSSPHMLERKTSEQSRPRASWRTIPVISSAARLNEVTRHARSMVKTPSEMLSRIASVGVKPQAFARIFEDLIFVFLANGASGIR
jgi:hypothetical protein